MKRSWILMAALALALPLAGHGAGSAHPFVVSEEPRTPTPAELSRAIRSWLECYECTQGELRRLVAMGVAAISELEAVASTVDPVLREQVAAELSTLYDDLRDHAIRTGASLSISKADYVTLKVEQYFELRKRRAERALFAIAAHVGTP